MEWTMKPLSLCSSPERRQLNLLVQTNISQVIHQQHNQPHQAKGTMARLDCEGLQQFYLLELAVVMNPQWPIRITEQGKVRF
jgi:hypothetical protein|mmetsp:Transcript_17400/g.49655  ORF Transcript_17400/g.49655 Transcript_17400/m.49655 type:complete len:82 (+) Transcript_17400:1502-1747(+)